MNFSVHKIKEMIIRLACTSHVPQFTISGYHELSSHELSIDLCLAYRSRLTKVVNLSPLITDALIGRPWPNSGREEVAVTLNVHVVCCIPLVELMMQCLSDDGEKEALGVSNFGQVDLLVRLLPTSAKKHCLITTMNGGEIN